MARPKRSDSSAAPEAASAKEAQRCARWKREIAAAGRREKDWRDYAEKVVKRYRMEESKKHAFNVLWSNTEVLRPAVYNSKPQPDVRRRFRDADPLGKAVGEVLERSLFVMVDGDATDAAIRNDVLDALLPGRGVSRVRYIPKLAPAGATAPSPPPAEDGAGARAAEQDDTVDTGSLPPEDNEESLEQVEDEQVILEHVDWRDFRHGYGRVWAEVPWVAFRHKLTRDDATDKFGEDAIAGVEFAVPTIEDDKERPDKDAETAKVAEFWEVWDKEGERVFFLAEKVKSCLYPLATPNGEPPLELEGFFPCPEPLKIIENTGSLMPICLFSQYEHQANQLDRISARIDKIVNALRLRGVYDARVSELRDLLDANDNDLVPTQNAAQWQDAGGLEKAIAWMPVEQAAKVLESLYDARDRQKAIIDEILGISDIVRGATDPDETLGAQRLKSNYYSARLRRMQDAVKRYVCDLIRLASQVIASKYGTDTLARMTNLNFPTAQQKQMLQAKLALAIHPPAPMGLGAPPAPQAPPPELLAALKVPTWEDILGMLRSPALRQFRVDVETDSMIAGSLEADMEGLAEVLKAVEAVMSGLAPLVQSKALPVEAAKELVMAVIRRARMGTAVEDAFDKMQPPKPPPDPNAGRLAEIQAKGQTDIQVAQMKAQLEAHVAQMQQQAQARQNAQEQALEAQRMTQKQQFDAMQAKLDAFVKIIVATISATKQPDRAVQPRADAIVGNA
jgi:hypothetical protein